MRWGWMFVVWWCGGVVQMRCEGTVWLSPVLLGTPRDLSTCCATHAYAVAVEDEERITLGAMEAESGVPEIYSTPTSNLLIDISPPAKPSSRHATPLQCPFFFSSTAPQSL